MPMSFQPPQNIGCTSRSGQARRQIDGDESTSENTAPRRAKRNTIGWSLSGLPRSEPEAQRRRGVWPATARSASTIWFWPSGGMPNSAMSRTAQPTSEIRSFKTALRPVRQLYGSEPVTNFGPLALVACRLKLIEAGICRKRINQHVGRIRHMFKWGVAREMVPETVWRALCAVEGLRVGEAIERPPVRAVSDERIAAIEHFVTPQVWAMVNLQIWSACRPGEACIMRAIDINMQGKIWEYRPHSHKTEHHDKERVIFLGPHAQEIIKPWLKTDLHAYLFSPKEARAWSQAQRAKNRKTPKPKTERKNQRKPTAEAGSRRTLQQPRLRPRNPPWLRIGFRHAQTTPKHPLRKEGRQRKS